MDILKKLQYFDVQLFTWLASSIRGPRILAIAKALSKSGDGYLHIGIPVLLLALNGDQVETPDAAFTPQILSSTATEELAHPLAYSGNAPSIQPGHSRSWRFSAL